MFLNERTFAVDMLLLYYQNGVAYDPGVVRNSYTFSGVDAFSLYPITLAVYSCDLYVVSSSASDDHKLVCFSVILSIIH